MQIERRHMGRIAEPTSSGSVGEVDVLELVHRMVLFEECLVESARLEEIPALARAFGPRGLVDLMNSGALTFVGDLATAAQTGQTATLETSARLGILPSGSFRLATVTLAKGEPHRAQYLGSAVQRVDRVEGSASDKKLLKRVLIRNIREYPSEATPRALLSAGEEIVGAGGQLVQAVRRATIAEMSRDPGSDIDIEVERLAGETDFRVVTNLKSRITISSLQEHKVVERALLQIAGFDLRLSLMGELNCLSGFRDEERDVFESRVQIAAEALNAANREDNFSRVIELQSLERSKLGSEPPIDVRRLIKLRQSDEIREVREWIQTVGDLSDDEIKREFSDRRDLVSSRLGTTWGRAIRFLVTTAAGILNPSAGVALTAVDGFLVNKLIGRPGPAAFLGRSYPSIFGS